MNDFDNMNKSPVEPLAIDILDEEIADGRYLIDPNVGLIFELKYLTHKILSRKWRNFVPFVIQSSRETLFHGYL